MSKVWFITGTSRGLGRAIAEHALEKGDFVVATARNTEPLEQLVKTYGSEKVLPFALDVTNWQAAGEAVKVATEKFKRIDIVVNNAGYGSTASVEDMDIANFREQVETNFMGVVHVTKAVIPVLRRQGSGHIFQISSVGGRLTTPGLSAYQSAKWAVGGFSFSLAAELAPLGVKISVLEPGGIRTEWAGPSMKILPVSEPYQQTVGEFAKILRGISGNETSDPKKFGPIIDQLYEAPEPPLRMLVGPDAVQMWAQASEAQSNSDEKWKQLSLSSSL
ncbi:uncharacterized protein K452DRAFT_257917 [Aplosporella prunicola CBS 121167]|uniref:Oxidoreductase n=1 Tax=Aplosporella prunicola CBS 121167 TaxID=1176127 RepID=A0A6A6AZZ5_9PEZI|nr:uncharacterized protein K452DRAFT_257917 [Aplosporella prunicola CBS 121167]KAF2137196.1 hypothetical protein K452DRAFT_257917 [Aplosporella prunicola CBS 121167]